MRRKLISYVLITAFQTSIPHLRQKIFLFQRDMDKDTAPPHYPSSVSQEQETKERSLYPVTLWSTRPAQHISRIE